MNLFDGRVEDLDNILVDNFLNNGGYTCFFLSHCHSDHMQGIKNLFSQLSETPGQYIYCSPISRLILLNKFGHKNEDFIKELTSVTIIKVPESHSAPGYEMAVTPIPAGHCPGSVMFLFEVVKKTVLYTGDFRIIKDDIKKFKCLHRNNEIKHINKLYLDSTFLNEEYWHFPLRTEVVNEISVIVGDWINKSTKHNVLLETSAMYGYEYVFVEVGRRLGCKIHVKDSIYDLYWNVPEVGSFLTKDCSSAKVHAAYAFETKCKSEDADWLKIKLSAQWFKTTVNDFKNVSWKQGSKNKMTICFATHCSCSELVDFIEYFHPDEVVPCSTPVGCSQDKVNEFINQLVWSTPKRKRERSPESGDDSLVLNKNYKFKLKFSNSISNDENCFCEDEPTF